MAAGSGLSVTVLVPGDQRRVSSTSYILEVEHLR